jgi:hypothetical protein
MEPTDEVKEKVNGSLQQQAVMKALTDFSKPRIRSQFKKSMLEQAQKFLRGEAQYKYPFSTKMVMCILEESFISRPDYECKIVSKVPKHQSYINHTLWFDNEDGLTVNDFNQTASFFVGQNKVRSSYIDARVSLIEALYDENFKFKIEQIGDNMIYTEIIND